MALSYDEWKKQKQTNAEPKDGTLSYDEWKRRKSGADEEISDGVTPVASSVSPSYYSFDTKAYGNDMMSLGIEMADREMELRPYMDRYTNLNSELNDIDTRLGEIKTETDNLFTQYVASPSDELYAQYTAGAQAYNDLSNQYNVKLEEAKALESQYGNLYSEYQKAWNALEEKRGQYDAWKSTVRDKTEIENELNDVIRGRRLAPTRIHPSNTFPLKTRTTR